MDTAPERPATAARIYDYLLGGVHNFTADREVAEKLIAAMPNVRTAARANRAFLGRAVRYLASQGSVEQAYDQQTMTGLAKPRTQAEVAEFFTGWGLVEPGIVWLSQWRPDPPE